MADDNTSSGAGATPQPDPPATGIPAPGSATPPAAPNLTLEEALRKLAELEHSHGNAREELERHRKKLTGYEKKEADEAAARKAAEDAQLSEIERIKKQHEEATQQIQHYKQQAISAQVKLAAQSRGINDPDLAALALGVKDQAWTLEYGEDGMPSNLEKALDALVKNKPIFAPKAASSELEQSAPTPAQTAQPNRPATPAIPAMNPGRTQIAAPGSNPPGRIPRLSDRGVFVPPGTPSKYQP